MAIIYQKGAATVAVRDEDMTTRKQLEGDGWTAQMAQSATRGVPKPQPAPPAAPEGILVDSSASPVTITGNTILPAMPMSTVWSPDLPANIVALLQQQFGTPANAAAATDADLFRIGGMTPGHIMAIRKGMAQG